MTQQAITAATNNQLANLKEQARSFAGASVSKNTRRAYRAGWQDFSSWCTETELEPLPASPDTVALFLTARSSQTVSTLRVKLAAIQAAHKTAGHHLDTSHPVIDRVWAGIRRTNGVAQQGAAPVLGADIRAMVAGLGGSMIDTRDRALLLIAFAGGFRRSELVALDVQDLSFSEQGVAITLRRSKTDQEGTGQVKAICHGNNPGSCPVAALQRWLEVAGISEGPIFRRVDRHGNVLGRLSGQSVSLIVKNRAAAAGLDTAKLSGHSLRAGLVTTAHLAGASDQAIMRQTGHKKVETLHRYTRVADAYRDNVTSSLGL